MAYAKPALGLDARLPAIVDSDYPRFSTGMMMVLQPNVITKDQRAGVQTGALDVITETGAKSLHTAPRGPFVVATQPRRHPERSEGPSHRARTAGWGSKDLRCAQDDGPRARS